MLFEVEECFREDAQKYIEMIEGYGLTFEFLETFLMLPMDDIKGLYESEEIKAMPKDLWHRPDEPLFCIDDIETYLYSDEFLIMGVMFRIEEAGGREKWSQKLKTILDKLDRKAELQLQKRLKGLKPL